MIDCCGGRHPVRVDRIAVFVFACEVPDPLIAHRSTRVAEVEVGGVGRRRMRHGDDARVSVAVIVATGDQRTCKHHRECSDSEKSSETRG